MLNNYSNGNSTWVIVAWMQLLHKIPCLHPLWRTNPPIWAYSPSVVYYEFQGFLPGSTCFHEVARACWFCRKDLKLKRPQSILLLQAFESNSSSISSSCRHSEVSTVISSSAVRAAAPSHTMAGRQCLSSTKQRFPVSTALLISHVPEFLLTFGQTAAAWGCSARAERQALGLWYQSRSRNHQTSASLMHL